MKSNKVKLRGRLRKSLYWPMFMTILLVCMNVVIYTEDILVRYYVFNIYGNLFCCFHDRVCQE